MSEYRFVINPFLLPRQGFCRLVVFVVDGNKMLHIAGGY
jgi:hypothetical protein